MASKDRGVSLNKCRICGNHWVEEHNNDEEWESKKCCEVPGFTIESKITSVRNV